jgi:flagellar basal-body rod protein FlgC
METSFSSAISGMQASILRHEVSAHDVANINTPGFQESRALQAEQYPSGVKVTSITSTPNPSSTESNTDLVEEAKEQIINKHGNAANAKVIKVQDRMIGEILDIFG